MDLTKSFAAKCDRIPFDWNDFLATDNITDKQWDNAAPIAANWVTCACGNQCYIIPRDPNKGNAPLDKFLKYCGTRFYHSIKAKNNDHALKFLKLIEQRSLFLIKEITDDKNKNQES